MQAPAPFYVEQKIPIARWMYPGKAYKARLILVPRKYDEAVLYIYVLDEQHVIAYRDEEMTSELGKFKLEHFEKIKELPIEEPPKHTCALLRPVTLGMLLDVPEHVAYQLNAKKQAAKEPIPAPVEPVNEPLTVETGQEEEKDEPVKVRILPADPPAKYEQLELALF
ncbi:hypothetical protein AAGS61_01650 [Lysinibacillus sp. KU-BSD001]|uniref:hypothetical protein n=1 Tax=Lysinibacillus sp. KU-BSD001 TaxID=3141328 RepID=UPI0036EA6517